MASTNKRRRTEVALTKEQCKTLLQRLRYYAKALAGKPVLITDDRVLTYGQLWQQVTEFREGLTHDALAQLQTRFTDEIGIQALGCA